MNAPATLDHLLPRLDFAHLDALEEESIFILREAAAAFERPALLFSGGKDSCVVLHLAQKAFKRRRAGSGIRGRCERARPNSPGDCRSRSFTSIPATTFPRCSPFATGMSPAWASA